jgi:hypothetical protein
MFCPKCGTSVPEGSKFCELCGNNMQQSGQNTETQQSSPQPEAQSAPQPASQPTPQPTPQPTYGPQATDYRQRPQPAPGYQNNTINIVDPREKVYGVGGWLGTIILSFIPVLGFILLLVWSFSGNTNKNKKNWAIAMLIVNVICIIISFILYATIIAALGNFLDQIGNIGDMLG